MTGLICDILSTRQDVLNNLFFSKCCQSCIKLEEKIETRFIYIYTAMHRICLTQYISGSHWDISHQFPSVIDTPYKCLHLEDWPW